MIVLTTTMLFTSMLSFLGDNDEDDDTKDGNPLGKKDGGIFRNTCPIYKLHGDIPHCK